MELGRGMQMPLLVTGGTISVPGSGSDTRIRDTRLRLWFHNSGNKTLVSRFSPNHPLRATQWRSNDRLRLRNRC